MPKKVQNLRRVVLIGTIFLAVFWLFHPENIVVGETKKNSPGTVKIKADLLLEETNFYRAKNNIPKLVSNEKLQAAAQKKAEDMAAKNYFSHTSPNGKTPWKWIEEENYHYAFAGENLAVGFENPKKVVLGWMNSPLHRKNVLNGNYREVGFGMARGEFDGESAIYVVGFYGNQKNRSFTIAIAWLRGGR